MNNEHCATNIIPIKDTFRMLKRYSFDAKMKICNKFSRRLIDSSGNANVQRIIDSVHPWELEMFLKMSIERSPEYQDKTFDGKQEKIFKKMINGLRGNIHPSLKEKSDEEFANYYMAAAGTTQFPIQDEILYITYRYNYIFSFKNSIVDMQYEFEKFFNTKYTDILELGQYLTLLYGSQVEMDTYLIDYLINEKYRKASQILTIDVKGYKEELKKLVTTQDDLLYCLCPSVKYPFIRREDKLYIPLPHMIMRSVTSSLLFRLTENNNGLRDKLGKEVLERYIYDILKESDTYDEIYQEREYEKEHHNKAKTVDVMLRDKDEYIFIDSKAAVPTVGLMIFKEESYKHEVDLLVKNIVQMYNQVRKYLPKYNNSYNPFNGRPVIDKKHIWGIVVRLEDNHIMRRDVYEKAARTLGVDLNSEEYEWLINHIKIACLNDIEKYSFTGRSLMKGIMKQIEKGKPTDFAFSSYGIEEVRRTSKKLMEFNAEQLKKILKISENLHEQGLLGE